MRGNFSDGCTTKCNNENMTTNLYRKSMYSQMHIGGVNNHTSTCSFSERACSYEKKERTAYAGCINNKLIHCFAMDISWMDFVSGRM